MLLPESPLDVAKAATLNKWSAKYGPKLLAMLARRLDARAAARRDPEDVLQEALLKAEKRWDDFARSGKTPYAWLYRLALDCLRDDHDYQHRQRRSIRKEQPLPDHSSAQMVLGLFSTGGSPSKAAAQAERQQRLRARMAEILAALRPKDRDILLLRHADDLEHKEIAQVLGIEEGTARARYARAREQLREKWVERYGAEDWQP